MLKKQRPFGPVLSEHQQHRYETGESTCTDDARHPARLHTPPHERSVLESHLGKRYRGDRRAVGKNEYASKCSDRQDNRDPKLSLVRELASISSSKCEILLTGESPVHHAKLDDGYQKQE